MKDVEKAKKILLLNDKTTIVFVKDQKVFTSEKRGVMPLIEACKSDFDYTGFSVADKVVGKGAAFLYELLNIHSLYAKVISKPALDLLEKKNITVSYDLLTDRIENRTKTGFCPIESAVFDVQNAQEAYKIIRETVKTLK